jgi:asparagine synthase (glutamine-hydrolysing)
MCGIAGVVHRNETVALAAARNMNAAQAHRGPDGEGLRAIRANGAEGGSLALGHRRLAIQDLSPAGAQPMENPETGDVIVYNGEVYNVAELRAALADGGLRGHSDTEIILKAFARWGIECLDRLEGMFAFALYAARENKVYLARDRLGIKPLYWSIHREGGLVFASELRAMLASGLVDRRIDRIGLQSVLAYGAVAGPRTMLEDVRLLDPGTWTAFDVGRPHPPPSPLRMVRYWEPPERPRVDRSGERAAEALRESLVVTVRNHLVGDVPVALFLSGGIDSTALAVVAGELRGGDIDTFTVRLEGDAAIDEAPVARRTAAAIGVRHHDVTLAESDTLALATRFMESLDQPTVDGLNTYVISRAARQQGIVVALSGLGGDEMFGGYSTFRSAPLLAGAAQIASRLPRGPLRALTSRLASRLGTRGDKLADLLDVEPSIAAMAVSRRRLMSNEQMQGLGFATRPGDLFLPPECVVGRPATGSSPWAIVRDVEARFYMGNMLLRDADVFGMAHGLEIRVPLLGTGVVDTALRFARPSIVRPGKPWLVKALEGRMPPEVLAGRKRGFSLPQARWMRGPLRDSFEARIEAVAQSGHVDPDGVRRVWERFLREPQGPAWSRAWLLGSLGEWLSRLHDGARARPHAVTSAGAA